MIYTERKTIGGREFDYTYSDTYTIMRDGVEYLDACDPAGSGREYTETTTPKEAPANDEISGEEFIDMRLTDNNVWEPSESLPTIWEKQ